MCKFLHVQKITPHLKCMKRRQVANLHIFRMFPLCKNWSIFCVWVCPIQSLNPSRRRGLWGPFCGGDGWQCPLTPLLFLLPPPPCSQIFLRLTLSSSAPHEREGFLSQLCWLTDGDGWKNPNSNCPLSTLLTNPMPLSCLHLHPCPLRGR